MRIVVVDGVDCCAVDTACWAAAYGAAFSSEVLALIHRGGNGFERSIELGDGEAATIIADAAVRALRASRVG